MVLHGGGSGAIHPPLTQAVGKTTWRNMIYYVEPTEEEKVIISLEKELHSVYKELEACQHRLHQTAFGVFLALVIGYLIGAEHVIYRVFGGW